MDALYLIKPGEILLKQDNQQQFVRALMRAIRDRMGKTPCLLQVYPGRLFLFVDEANTSRAEFVLSHCPGINGFARATLCQKVPEAVLEACVRVAAEALARGSASFKVETRRSDKSFPLGSYELSALAGETILARLPSLRVDVHNPDFIVSVEIRERAYVYGLPTQGPRGLPTGTSGRGLLLLSGGIDSPVAGYLMAKRGLALDAVYFHAYPYTSMEAQEKAETLARKLSAWTGSLRLWIVPFTDVQMAIKRLAGESATTLMLRTAMMSVADRLARKSGASSLITGESLGQVASQTAENMRVTQSPTDLPVFRPLIGTDKEDIIAMAKKIETYETSILPYEDCCVLFSPRHPVLAPHFPEAKAAYAALSLNEEIEKSIAGAEQKTFRYDPVSADSGNSGF